MKRKPSKTSNPQYVSIDDLPHTYLEFDRRECEDTIVVKDKAGNEYEIRLAHVVDDWLGFWNTYRVATRHDY